MPRAVPKAQLLILVNKVVSEGDLYYGNFT